MEILSYKVGPSEGTGFQGARRQQGRQELNDVNLDWACPDLLVPSLGLGALQPTI